MNYLIVNGDDFGASRGINRGILEAHETGILTSTSLMVNSPSARDAAALSRAAPKLSVGLLFDLRIDGKTPADDSRPRLSAELRDQLRRFRALMGRLPTHLDSHHNVHRDPAALPLFAELAQEFGLPLRGSSAARPFSRFYGWWGGQTHPEQISVESLARMLRTELDEGITELICHPGYVDPDFPTGYATERAIELQTLCDPTLRPALADRQIYLVAFHHLASLAAGLPT